jgi:K(+)-stimulated pyrophosphate-energized sodium pump
MEASLIAFLTSIAALLVAAYLSLYIAKKDSGTDHMREVSRYIKVGTRAYLHRQVRTISLFVPLLAVAIFFIFDLRTSVAFVLGVFLSLLSGYVGMNVAVMTNVRTTSAARSSPEQALRIAFLGGAVMGILVPSLSIIGLYLLRATFIELNALVGFGFGASLAALFAQIGGGIFTKSADIGADLVGKIEESIPEDDPRNAAVIADLVGDNVGDCAGRGSDLFQSFSGDIITGIILGSVFVFKYGSVAVTFHFIMQALGLFASIIGISLVREWRGISPSRALFLGLLVTTTVNTVGLYYLSTILLKDFTIFLAGLFGISAMLLSILVVLYYTGLDHGPVKQVANASKNGAAITIITGLSYGLQSSILPITLVVIALVLSYIVSGHSLYSVVITNIGTDLVIGFIMASDTFGPITDNASGIAEMTVASSKTRETLGSLDAVGNTMKASTKAYAVASGTVTAFVIFATYFENAGITNFSVRDPFALAAFFIGVALPLPFSSLTISATAGGAYKMVDEVRRQFREIPGLREGTTTPDYARCVDISTANALRGMILPGLLAVTSPIIIGLAFGPSTLGMLLVGATASSAILGFFFNNVGAIFDNAKKYIEKDFWMKGTPEHSSAVTGDVVGDPLKDVAGPSLLIFMKLLGMTALLILPLLLRIYS